MGTATEPKEANLRESQAAGNVKESSGKYVKCLIKEDLDKDGLTLQTAHPEPEVKLDEVKIKVLATAVCGTDKSIYASANNEGIRSEMRRYLGEQPYKPIVVGHEFCGIVESVGDGANASALSAPDHLRVQVGDYVTAECTWPVATVSSAAPVASIFVPR